MKKALLNSKLKGFSLVEAIVAVAVFAIIVSFVATELIRSHKFIINSGNHYRAVALAEEGLEAVRNIRDNVFANLTNNTHGISTSGAAYAFSGNQDTRDIFTRQIYVSTIDSITKEVKSEISWTDSGGDQTVSLSQRLTDWRKIRAEAEQLQVDVSNAQTDSDDATHVTGITIENINDTETITITAISVSWTGAPGGTNLTGINIDGNSVWSGSDSSGDTQDITDFILTPGHGTYPIDYLDFSNDMSGATITIVFTMLDGTTKTVTFTLSGDSAPTSCDEYCVSLETYTQGTCRKGKAQCTANGETMENGGNSLCTQAQAGTCCCRP